MPRPFARGLLALLSPAVVLLMAPTPGGTAASPPTRSFRIVPGTGWTHLAGSVSPALDLARRVGSLSMSRRIGITVELGLRHTDSLDRLIRAVSDPASSDYGRFLTPAEFAVRFGPTDAQRENVAAWLRARGFRIDAARSTGAAVQATATVAQVQRAFDTPLATYRRGHTAFFGNSRAIRLPGAIAGDVTAVVGLTNAGRARPMGLTHASAPFTPVGFAPSDLAQAYDLTPLRTRGIDGKGQTIGIASYGKFDQANISTFDKQFNLSPPAIQRTEVDDGIDTGPAPGGNDESEAETDVEVLQGAAPDASIHVYEAPNDDAGFVNNWNRIVEDDAVSLVSTSWGEYEAFFPPDEMRAVHQALQQAAAQGQTVFAASGDNGAYDAYGGNDPSLAGTPTVDFPCSDPYVTCVGGTVLTTSAGAYASETAWSYGSRTAPTGGGGGLSVHFKRPAYQTGPGVINSYSNGMRQVPDVSAEADNHVGYALYVLDFFNGEPDWGQYGGTSTSTPLWTAFAALVQQAVGHRLGFLNPTLYRLGSAASTFTRPPFHDITQGTNLVYPATPGWDFASGWGSFDGDAFVQDLQSLPAVKTTPVPTPTGWKNGRPLPTATPAPTRVPRPAITITSIVLTHKVRGHQVETASLRLGERGTLDVLFKVLRGRPVNAFGSVLFHHRGKLVDNAVLKEGKYGARQAFIASVRVTSRSAAGTITARVALSLNDTTTVRTRTFKVLSTS